MHYCVLPCTTVRYCSGGSRGGSRGAKEPPFLPGRRKLHLLLAILVYHKRHNYLLALFSLIHEAHLSQLFGRIARTAHMRMRGIREGKFQFCYRLSGRGLRNAIGEPPFPKS